MQTTEMLKRAELPKHLLDPKARIPLLDRLSKYSKPDGRCVIWTGATNGNGYGVINIAKRNHYVHVVSWEIDRGRKARKGFDVHHKCEVTRCMNPRHLQLLKHKSHMRISNGFGGINHRKTSCPQGHLYTTDNTYHAPNGSRYCYECGRVTAAQKRKKLGTYRGRRYAARRKVELVNS